MAGWVWSRVDVTCVLERLTRLCSLAGRKTCKKHQAANRDEVWEILGGHCLPLFLPACTYVCMYICIRQAMATHPYPIPMSLTFFSPILGSSIKGEVRIAGPSSIEARAMSSVWPSISQLNLGIKRVGWQRRWKLKDAKRENEIQFASFKGLVKPLSTKWVSFSNFASWSSSSDKLEKLFQGSCRWVSAKLRRPIHLVVLVSKEEQIITIIFHSSMPSLCHPLCLSVCLEKDPSHETGPEWGRVLLSKTRHTHTVYKGNLFGNDKVQSNWFGWKGILSTVYFFACFFSGKASKQADLAQVVYFVYNINQTGLMN